MWISEGIAKTPTPQTPPKNCFPTPNPSFWAHTEVNEKTVKDNNENDNEMKQ